MTIEVTSEKNREYLATVLAQRKAEVAYLESDTHDNELDVILAREIFLEADREFIKELEAAIAAWDAKERPSCDT